MAARSDAPRISVPARFLRSEYLVLWLSGVYLLIPGAFIPGFLSLGNLANVLGSLLPLFLVALGLTVVLIAGGIDLSVTAVLGLASVAGAKVMGAPDGWLAGHALATPVAVLVMLGTGAAVGACNGLAIGVAGLPAFIVTLTSLMFFSGLAVWSTHSQNLTGLPASFNALGGTLGLSLLVTAAAGVLVHGLLARSLAGRWLYAVGGNPRAARISGVPVRGVTVAAYVVSGICAALASVLYTGQSETGSPVLGQRVLLDVLGGTVLGGTSLQGGKGRVGWTLCGVLFLRLVDNSLNLLGLSVFTITMIKGAVILAAALLDAGRHRLAGGRT